MRHGKKFNHLSRTAPHRKAMLSNMATSLILNKRISTTVAKAKALKKYVEPLLTKSKSDTTHSRRIVFSYLNDKESVKTLFDEVAAKIADRPGGYTRILKTGNRLGDNADMCIIELVDYNELLLGDDKSSKSKTRRSRRGKGGGKGSADASGSKTTETKPKEEKVEAKKEEEKVDAKKEEKVEAKKEETATEEKEEAKAEKSSESEKKKEAKAEKSSETEEKKEEPKAEKKDDKKSDDK